MGNTITIKANPEILIWAREEAGYTQNELASKLHIPVQRYIEWEENGQNIPLGMLKKVANYYKRQLAVFCLPKTPPKISKPKDFRNLANDHKDLTSETLLVVRRTNKYLKLVRDLEGESYWNGQYSWLNDIDQISIKTKKINNLEYVNWLHSKFKIDIVKQKKLRNFDDAFKLWRNQIEKKLGIFVFQFPMPQNELDGFSYALDKPPYAIVINSHKDNLPQRKIFTLFHELGHILKNQPGICFTDMYRENQLEIEYECNDFAGKFLIPDNNVFPVESLQELQKISHSLFVSREVYLRRVYDNDLISKTEFFNLLKNVRQTTKPKKKKQGKIAIKRSVLSKSRRGDAFFNSIVEAAYNNRIDFATATDVLNLKINNILNE